MKKHYWLVGAAIVASGLAYWYFRHKPIQANALRTLGFEGTSKLTGTQTHPGAYPYFGFVADQRIAHPASY